MLKSSLHTNRGFLLLITLILITSLEGRAQTQVWFEDFGTSTPCDQGTDANNFVSANGAWTVTDVNPPASDANKWYISATEPGQLDGVCEVNGCNFDPTADNRSLHVGNVSTSPNSAVICASGDCGALYDRGGFQNVVGSDKRAESPVINLTGFTNNTLVFTYFEGPNASNGDNATVDYFDGSSWVSIDDPPSTTGAACGVGLGEWKRRTITLPPSADNNPNVKIGFHWINDEGGLGENPSFAVDDIYVISLSGDSITANFTANDTDICVSSCVNFIADTSLLITSYNWFFTGGTPATWNTAFPPAICYNNPGTFPVRLIVSGPTGTDTLTIANYITVGACQTPSADFIASDSSFCERDCIIFTDFSTAGPVGWRWFFPGGIPDSSNAASPPPICYNAPGAYDVTLIVTNAYGSDTLVKTGYINVNSCPLPIANFTTQPIRLCPQYCVSYTADTTGGINYFKWSFPGGIPDTSSSPNPVICYDREGLYDATLIVGNQNGFDTLTQFSVVQVSFVPGAFVSPDTAMAFGQSYQLEAGGGALYQWIPPLGLDSINSDSPLATPPRTVTYTVTITDLAGCSTTRQVTITILQENRYYIPNTFSPNGDGYNDYLFVRGNNIFGIRFTIFDRWGEKVFESTDPLKPWDGTKGGKELDPGVFTYVVTVNFDDGKSFTESGTVTLVK